MPRPGDKLSTGFAELIGTEMLEESEGYARARVEVRDELLQPYGLVHGGVYAALAETLASRGTHNALAAKGKITVGQMNHTTFLRPISSGHVNAEARARHRGRTTWVWQVELTDDEGHLCALVEMTVAVRPR